MVGGWGDVRGGCWVGKGTLAIVEGICSVWRCGDVDLGEDCLLGVRKLMMRFF